MNRLTSLREQMNISYRLPDVKDMEQYIDDLQIKKEALDYLHGRGFSDKTIEHFKLGYNSKLNAISIPVFKDKKLINIRYRLLSNDKARYSQEKNCEVWLYNEQGLEKARQKGWLLIVEGECFNKNAEILTEKGFIKFEDYKGQKVGIFDNGIISFKEPIKTIKKKFNGNLLEIKNQKGFYSLTTPKHNIVLQNKKGEFEKQIAESHIPKTKYIPRVGIYSGKGINLSDDELKLFIAVAADFTIRKTGDVYGILKKERKKKRIELILKKVGIKYTKTVKENKTSYFIRRGNAPKYLKKIFPTEWIGKMSRNQIDLFLSEIVLWDGNFVKNRNQVEFSSKHYSEVSFVQTLAHMSGYVSTIMKRKNQFGEWYKVSILFNKTRTSTQNIIKKNIKYNDYVYCVTVNTGMIVVRQNGCISISGNCDLMSCWQMGFDNVISPASGKDSYMKWIEQIDSIPKVCIAYDNDKPGKSSALKLAEKIGVEKCKEVIYPHGYNDANEYFTKHVSSDLKKDFFKIIKDSSYFYKYTFTNVGDIMKDMFEYSEPGFKLDMIPHVEFEGDWIVILSGDSGTGKTSAILNIAKELAEKNIPTLIFPYERGIKSVGKRYLQILFEKSSYDFQNINMKSEEKEKMIFKVADQQVYFSLPDTSKMIETIRKAKRIFDIEFVIIDHLDYMVRQTGENYNQAVGKTMQEYKLLAQQLNINFIIVHHINKPSNGASASRRPKKESLKGSSSIYQDSEAVIMLYRKDEHAQELEMIVVKNKGEHGYKEFSFNTKTGVMKPTSEDKTGSPEVSLDEEFNI